MKKESIMYAIGYTVLGLILLFGAVLAWSARATVSAKITEQEEAAKPAEIELTLIAPSSCDQCIDGKALLEEIEKQDVRVLGAETFLGDSEEGKSLIAKYEIKRLPAILVEGQYDKANIREALDSLGAEEKDAALLIQVKQPVYVDVASNAIVGLVDATYLTDSSCPDCYDPTQHRAILVNTFNVTIQSEKSIDAQSAEGRALIDRYAITQTPALLLSSQAASYDRLVETWKQVGTIEEDGTFVFRQSTALGAVTYKDLTTGEVVRPETPKE